MKKNLVIPLFTLYPALSCAQDGGVFFTADLDSSSAKLQDESKNITRYKIDAGYEFDLTNLLGWESTSLVSYSLRRGKNASDFVGDIQSFSNVDEVEYSKLYEAYVGMEVFETANIKFGLMDATSDFAAPYYGDGFINASAGFSPTILDISTFPTPKLGIYLDKTFDGVKLKFAAYSVDENRVDMSESFQIGEIELAYGSGNYVRFGGWYHTALEDINGETGSEGDVYAVVDHAISDKLNGFVQYGHANAQYSEITTHWALGINYQGIFFHEDNSGIVLSDVKVHDSDTETAIELYTDITIGDNFSIKPSLIYIANIAGEQTLGDAKILNIRLSLSF